MVLALERETIWTPELISNFWGMLNRSGTLNEVEFTENLIKIADKARNIIPFRRNSIQRKFDEYETGRDIALKPAQVGFSSRIIAKILVKTISIPGTVSLIVAHDEFMAKRLLDKSIAFYNSIPVPFKPEMFHNSSHEKLFIFKDSEGREVYNRSVLYIYSAQAKTVGRGENIHNFLADEYAFWPDTENIMGPTMDRVVPVRDGGSIWVLSTPNGEDNAFCEMYRNGLEEDSPFTSHFFPWFMHEEYQLEEGHPDALKRDRGPLVTLDSDEQALQAKGVTEEQLRWRRLKLAEKAALRMTGETSILFFQEFPSDDVSCFLSAGDMVYDADLVNEKARKCYPAIKVTPEKIHIWEAPKAGANYHIGVDPGQGKQTKSAVTVWRFWLDTIGDGEKSVTVEHGKLVARYAELEDDIPTARATERLCNLYFSPQVAPEVNGHGIAFLRSLNYSKIYKREDIVKGRKTKQLGWLTTTRTKPAMIREFRDMLPNLEIYDIMLISELRNIREVKGNKTENYTSDRTAAYVSVGADDVHDSGAIAVITRPGYSTGRGTKSYGY